MKFSIGIPAYKVSFLKECIESVLVQSCRDFELVIVNDASPENIDGIVAFFSDERIKYYKNEKNIGVEHLVDNWNICLSYATGDYFALIGDDDKLCQNFLEEYSILLSRYPDLDVYHCRSMVIDENGKPLRLTEPRPEYESVFDLIYERIKMNRTQFVGDFLYKTSSLKQRNGFYKLPMAWGSDDITAFISSSSLGIAHTNNPIFMYRESGFTLSSIGNCDLKFKAIQGEKAWITSFIDSVSAQETDLILKINIQGNLNKYFHERIVHTLMIELYAKRMRGLPYYVVKSRYYNYTIFDILKICIRYIIRIYQNRADTSSNK